MRGKAEGVLMCLEKKDRVGPFVIFERWKPGKPWKEEDDRIIHNLTEIQIDRVADVVNRMSLEGKLCVRARSWGWAASRIAAKRRKDAR